MSLKKLFQSLNQKPIAFKPIYATITGKWKVSNLTNNNANNPKYLEKNQSAGVLLSQLCYWGEAMNWKEFYKSKEELADECGCSMYAIDKELKLLVELGFVKVSLKIPNGTTGKKIHFVIDEEAIIKAILVATELSGKVATELSGKVATELSGKVATELSGNYNKQRIITENTTEREAPSQILTSSGLETIESLTQKIKSNEYYSDIIQIGSDKGYTEEEVWNLVKPKIIVFLSEKQKANPFSRFALWIGDLAKKGKDTNYSQKPSRIETKGAEKPTKMVNPLDFATEERYQTYCSQESKYFELDIDRPSLFHAQMTWNKTNSSNNKPDHAQNAGNTWEQMKAQLLAKKSFNLA